MSYSSHQYQLREVAVPIAPTSRYRTIYPQEPRRFGPAANMQRHNVFGRRLSAVISTSATIHGVPSHIASALASWSIPIESWIHYYKGTYAWPAGLAIPDPRVSRLEQSPAPTRAFLPQFTSKMATSPRLPPDSYSLSLSNSRSQNRRILNHHYYSLRSQYGTSSLPRPVDCQRTNAHGWDGQTSLSDRHTSLKISEEDMCPPPGFNDPKYLEEKLTDLRAIVNFIVPAGGLDPTINYGPAIELLKYTPGDDIQGIEHFIRRGEAQDPDFMTKLSEFCNDGPGDFRGASPTDSWRKKEMAAWGYVEYGGEWVKMEDVGKVGGAGQQQQQPHPAQIEDELEYQEDYRHAEIDDDYTGDFEGDFEDDIVLVGTMKRSTSKKGSPKWQKGSGLVRRRSSSSSKSKRETKQQKMDRGSKEDEHRSCFDLL